MRYVVLLTVFIFLLTGCSRGTPVHDSDTTKRFQVLDGQLVAATLGERQLQLEVASSLSSITQGLSGREVLGSDGLLFVLPTPTTPQFWMKDMKFDLDLVWIREGEVVEVTAGVPHPNSGTNLQDLPLYSPRVPVDMVLELEAGKAAEWGISPGARLQVK